MDSETSPAPQAKLDYRRLDNPETEQEQVEAYAQTQIGAMEIAAVFVQAVESWGYSKRVLDRFEKFIRKALNELESEIPNQHKRKVLAVMSEALRDADGSGLPLPPEDQPDILVALMGAKARQQMEAALTADMEQEAAAINAEPTHTTPAE